MSSRVIVRRSILKEKSGNKQKKHTKKTFVNSLENGGGGGGGLGAADRNVQVYSEPSHWSAENERGDVLPLVLN